MTREEAIKFGKRVLSLSPFDELREFCEIAIKALEQRWIPVSERLPEQEDEYLCTIQTREIYTDKVIDKYINFCNFTDGGCGVFDDETVTAWMSLPEPYTAESGE